jgi:NAD+ synthase (glutamine-hydrolysing)
MKIVLAQCNFTVGDFAGNVGKIAQIYAEHANTADLVVFTELCLSGYFPMDLLSKPDFLAAQDQALDVLKKLTEKHAAGLVVGFVARNSGHGKPIANALALLERGDMRFCYHKRLLPTYNIFDEARHFEPGDVPGVHEFRKLRIGFAICEDLWNDETDRDYDDVPIRALKQAGAQLLLAINASPSNWGKHAERLSRFSASAKRHALTLISVNQVGGYDEIVFDGNSFAFDQIGALRLQMPEFAEACAALTLDLHGGIASVDSSASPRPVAVSDSDARSAFFNAQITLGLQDYLRKCGFKRVVVGSSGGIDSALTIALAARAIGAENVLAVTMPSRYSSSGSVDDSEALCEQLGVSLRHAPIESQFRLACEDFARAHGVEPSALTQQNIQARLRGRMLMEVTNHFGHLLLSTGNKSEMSVGYATLYGDMNGGLNLIGDLYKMDVFALARWINQDAGQTLIPESIITKAPSAELAPGQKDSDSLPEYPILDAILRLAIEGQMMPTIEVQQLRVMLRDVPKSEIERVLAMIARAEFKRRQAPPIIRCQRRAFGIGWRMPIAQRFVSSVDALLGVADSAAVANAF